MRRLSILLVLALLLACGRREAKSKPLQQAGLVSLAESSISEIVPTADGGAYIVTLDSGLWYMRGTEAVRVVFKEAHGQARDQPLDGLLVEVTPTVDGGAYARTETGKTIWYLKEASAFRVAETLRIPKQGHVTRPRDNYFSLYIAELTRRRAIEKFQEYYEDREPEE